MFDFIGLKDLLLVDANIEFFQKDVMGIVVVCQQQITCAITKLWFSKGRSGNQFSMRS
jgi:hypothetical protein